MVLLKSGKNLIQVLSEETIESANKNSDVTQSNANIDKSDKSRSHSNKNLRSNSLKKDENKTETTLKNGQIRGQKRRSSTTSNRSRSKISKSSDSTVKNTIEQKEETIKQSDLDNRSSNIIEVSSERSNRIEMLSDVDDEDDDDDDDVEITACTLKHAFDFFYMDEETKPVETIALEDSDFEEDKIDVEEHIVQDIETNQEKVTENNRQEPEESSQACNEELKSFEVQLPYPVCKLHEIDTRLFRNIPKPKELRELIANICTGPYTSQEDEIILNNWTNFCKLHKIKEDSTVFINIPKLSSLLTPPNIQKFLQFLSHGLDERIMRGVYTRFVKLMHDKKLNERFKGEEDDRIIELMTSNSSLDSCQNLAKTFHVTEKELFDRYSQIIEKIWSTFDCEKFLLSLLKITKSKHVEELKNLLIPEPIWKYLSLVMALPIAKLKCVWISLIYPKQFLSKSSYQFRELVKEFVNILYEENFKTWADIDWSQISQKLFNIPCDILVALGRNLFKFIVPQKRNFEDAVSILKNFIQSHRYWKYDSAKLKLQDNSGLNNAFLRFMFNLNNNKCDEEMGDDWEHVFTELVEERHRNNSENSTLCKRKHSESGDSPRKKKKKHLSQDSILESKNEEEVEIVKIKKNKKHETNNDIIIDNNVEYISESPTKKKKHKKHDLDLTENTSCSIEHQKKKKKKKHKNLEIADEIISENIIENNHRSNNQTEEISLDDSSTLRKKKKKRKNHEVVDEIILSDDIVEEPHKSIEEISLDESSTLRKKKKKHKSKDSIEETSVDEQNTSEKKKKKHKNPENEVEIICNGDIVEKHHKTNKSIEEISLDDSSTLRKKKKKHKSKDSFNNETSVDEINTSDMINPVVKVELTWDEDNVDHHKSNNSLDESSISKKKKKKHKNSFNESNILESTKNNTTTYEDFVEVIEDQCTKKKKRKKSASNSDSQTIENVSEQEKNKNLNKSQGISPGHSVIKPKSEKSYSDKENLTNLIETIYCDNDDGSTPKKNSKISPKSKKFRSKSVILNKEIEKNILHNLTQLSNEKPIYPRRRKSLFALRFEEEVDDSSSKHSLEFDPDKVNSLRDVIEAPLENIQDVYENSTPIEVMLPFDVPELHLIETRISNYPPPEQKRQIDALGVEVKTGVFSKSEDEIIRNNFKKFCKMHDLTEDPTPFMNFRCFNKVLSKENRVKFTRFLAHKLDNRLLHCVYGRFKRLMQNEKNQFGRFTEHEDNIILEYVNASNTPNPYADLSKILNRSKVSIYKRYTHLTSEDPNANVRLKWDPEKIENFLRILVKVTDVNNLKELKTRNITPEEWKQVSAQMFIPHEKLKRSWKNLLYQKLFAEDFDKTDEVREEIINRLYDNKESDWRTINWTEIAKSFPGFTPERLSKFFKGLVHYHVPENMRKNLSECLHYLKHVFLVNHKLCGNAIKRIKVDERRIIGKKNEGET